jgi:hypothetical protein
LPPVSTEYTFTIDFADGVQQIFHDTVKAYVPVAPALTVTPGQNTANFNWTNISASVANASYYWVVVSGDNLYWRSDNLPLTVTSATFNENGTAQGVLESGNTYDASISIFNETGDYAYQFVDFAMP